MFTGIVEELGEVVDVKRLDDAAVLKIRMSAALADGIHRGDSYAINGVCLTATDHVAGDDLAEVDYDVMGETLHRSSLGKLLAGDPVNLERPVRLEDRLGGHLVQGHVDAVGEILRREPQERWDVVTIGLPAGIARYVVEKGSITVDGISLTVAAVDADTFSVALIPETLARTTLGTKGVGAVVNLEVDVVAKYVEKLMRERRSRCEQ
ncbi:MAG TPA: riboflavin synthase [Mycobacteriales bacterium]